MRKKPVYCLIALFLSISLCHADEYLQIEQFMIGEIRDRTLIEFDSQGYIKKFSITTFHSNGGAYLFDGEWSGDTYTIYDNIAQEIRSVLKKEGTGFSVYDKDNTFRYSIDINGPTITANGYDSDTGKSTVYEILTITPEEILYSMSSLTFIYPMAGGLRRAFYTRELEPGLYNGSTKYRKTGENSFILYAENRADPYYSLEYRVKTNHTRKDLSVICTYLPFTSYLSTYSNMDSIPFVIGMPPMQPGDYTGQHVYYSDSYLTEGKAVYAPSNLASKDGLPWASARGKGIGDTIVINHIDPSVSELRLVNGYVSEEKPYLYGQNSRIKKAKLTHIVTGESVILEFADTAEEQRFDIRLGNSCPDFLVTFEVLEVYAGLKYDDLCIQMLRFD